MPDDLPQAPDGTVDTSPPPERAARRLPPPRRAAPPADSASPGGRGPEAPEAPVAEGSAVLSGEAARKAWKAAESALRAAQRNARGRYPRKGALPVRPRPGMNRRTPPQPPGGTP
jgi:hypothetical protein